MIAILTIVLLGMVYLNPKSGAPSTDDSKLTIPFATVQLSPENHWQHIPDPLGLNGEQTWRALAQAVHDIVDLDTRMVRQSYIEYNLCSPSCPPRSRNNVLDVGCRSQKHLPCLASLSNCQIS